MASARIPYGGQRQRAIVALLVSVSTMLTFLCGTSTAQTQSTPVLDPVVVSSSYIPTTLRTNPESITVLTHDQIEAQHAISTVELLRQIPGVHIDQPGGRGGVSSVYTRGSDPNFTVVLIDGVKVNDPTNTRGGSFDFSTLDPGSIERIEVVRGPLSAVHGSDAMGGVINIITRQGDATPTISVEGSGGRESYHRVGAAARGPLGKATYALSFAYVDDGSSVEGSGFVGKQINGKIALPPSDKTWLQLSARYSDSHNESFPDDSGGPEFAILRRVDERDIRELSVGAEFGHAVLSWWEYELKFSFFEREEDMSSPGVLPGIRDPFGIPPNRNDSDFRRFSIVPSSLFSLSASLQAVVGVDMQFEDGDSHSTLVLGDFPLSSRFALDRAIYAPFLEAQYVSPLGLTVRGGVRVDVPDGFDTEVSPRVGILYRLASLQTTLKANWGEGFKLPSFFALGNALVGNPALVPETSEGFDIGLGHDFWAQRATANVTFFRTWFFNLIDLDEGPPLQLVNRSKVTAQGVELALALRPSDSLWVNSHLTYVRTDIRHTTEELRNRPEWRSGVNARWQVRPDLVFNAGLLYVGEVLDSSIPTGDHHLDDYVRVDVAATWTLSSHWQITFAIDNLFDADYEEALGFPARGITPRLTARLTF